jgi:IclR family pca regulon transcriptional regulator
MTGSSAREATRGGAQRATEQGEDGRRSGRFSSSLKAGLAILSCFTAERPVLGIATLAADLQMSRSTTHRYASTLVALGYLEQDQSRRYRLAPRAADFGMAVLGSMPLRARARGPLRELRESTGLTVSLTVLDRDEIRYVEHLRGWRRGQYPADLDVGLGACAPAHGTAMGRVLLAGLPESERTALIQDLARGRRALRADLEQVGADGFAIAEEELAPGMITIAVPVVGVEGETIAAIGISAPTGAFSREEMHDALGQPLESAARRISVAMRR